MILGLALQPPHLEDIEKTILCLKEVIGVKQTRTSDRFMRLSDLGGCIVYSKVRDCKPI